MPKRDLEISMSLNVLNHLGINLYSNIPAVLSEIISNAWDADASNVLINIDIENGIIEISDDGIGMTYDEINDHFLHVGYEKRLDLGTSTNKGRKVMGRKGIGKLSVFSIADDIKVYSRRKGEDTAFQMKTSEIKDKIKDKKTYYPKILPFYSSEISSKTGTKIILSGIRKRVTKSLDDNLRKRVARRFLLDDSDFKILINGEPITISDRDYYSKVEYVMIYGNFDNKVFDSLSNFDSGENPELRSNEIEVEGKKFQISGWLGVVKESSSLIEGDDSINKVSVFSRGKVAEEDILSSFGATGLFTKYLVGEISADFLDADEFEDIATSSRQSYINTDPRYILLKEFLKKELKYIELQRSKLKDESGTKEALKIEAINEWFTTLKGKDQKNNAKKLFGKINQINCPDDQKKLLFKHGILAFEKLQVQDNISLINNISIENLEGFLDAFRDYDEYEAVMYHEITRGRLSVISRLDDKISEDALEKVLQEIIYNHLWLLDPSWDRATEDPSLEKSITTQFDVITSKLTEEEKKGRMDIKYRKTSGKHIIIELKRASVKTDTASLQSQVNKYRHALKEELKSRGINEPIEVICIVGNKLTDWVDSDEREKSIESLKAYDARVVTYKQLISDSIVRYREYLDRQPEVSRLRGILDKIDK